MTSHLYTLEADTVPAEICLPRSLIFISLEEILFKVFVQIHSLLLLQLFTVQQAPQTLPPTTCAGLATEVVGIPLKIFQL